VALLGQLHDPPSAAADDSTWQRILAQPRRTVLVAEQDGAVVATADVIELPTLTHGGSASVFVQNAVVDVSHRRTGIGRELFGHIESYARQHGHYKIEFLSADTRPDAHAFYEALGFARSAEGFRKYL
jgi:GNAT superfamily N-acetyltransferase